MRNIVTDKEYKNYDRISRYSSFPFYYNKTDNKYFYGITSHLKTENVKYVGHKVKQGDTLDTLSLYYFNSPLYYWAIADFNKINDPYQPLKVGSILKIPTFSNIEYKL